MQSMTGFGSGKYGEDGRDVTIEVKSVNHRFLDVNQKLPRHLSFLESEFREAISNKLSRGHVEVFISYENTREDSKHVEVDMPLLEQYMQAVGVVESKYTLSSDVGLEHLLSMNGVFKVTEQEDDQAEICRIARKAMDAALDKLVIMRKVEGENLYKDIIVRVESIKGIFKKIVELAPQVPIEYYDKLKQRMGEILSGVDINEDRLMMEAAVFSDKCNIDEEIARFNSHIMQFEKSMVMDIPVGRKLDFTLQEINREINTIGSKANHAEISTAVMDVKAELEKIREQVQNIE